MYTAELKFVDGFGGAAVFLHDTLSGFLPTTDLIYIAGFFVICPSLSLRHNPLQQLLLYFLSILWRSSIPMNVEVPLVLDL